MEFASLILFATALAVSAGSPGPGIAALVARVLQRGWRDVLPFLAAMWIGEMFWLSLAIFGLAAIAETFHLLFLLIKYAGIAFLCYLAWRMWHAPAAREVHELPPPDAPWKLFASGLALTFGNPKLMIFYLALLPALIDLAAIGFSDWLLLLGVTALVLAMVDLSWVFFASSARRLLRTPRAVRFTNKFSAGMMAGAASFLAVRQ